jgi:hypothetical protein
VGATPRKPSAIERLCKGTEILANQLGRANTHLHFFRGLLGSYGELRGAKDFWDYTLVAHSGMAIRDLSVVFDTHKKGINLINLLRLVDVQSLDTASGQKWQGFVALAEKSSGDPLVRALREWRNNIVAHYNEMIAATDREEFWKQNPLNEAMLQALVDRGFEILDWCSHIGGLAVTFPRLAAGKDGYLTVLERLSGRPGAGGS